MQAPQTEEHQEPEQVNTSTYLRKHALSILQSSSNRTEAAERLEEFVRKDKDVLLTLLYPFLSQAIWQLIRQLDRKETPPPRFKDTSDEEKSGIQSDTTPARPPIGLAAVARRNILEMKMFNGLALGDANRDVLTRAVEHHKEKARTNTNLSAFYNNLLYRVGNQTVKEAFATSQLENLASRFGVMYE